MNRFHGFIILVLAACTRVPERGAPIEQEICIFAPSGNTRASDPEEDLITDYNLLIFNEFGVLEESCFVSSRELSAPVASVRRSTRLLKDAPYWFLSAANLGYALPCTTLEEALSYRYHMAYPDEYSQGLPMAVCKRLVAGEREDIELPLERLMARIDLSIDRSGLNPDVQLRVVSVQVRACPSSVRLFARSRVESEAQCFPQGFTRSGQQVYGLNHDVSGHSGTVTFYLLENLQGPAPEERLLPLCSCLELQVEYHYDTFHTAPGETIPYRIFLGEDYDVRRNTVYPFVVRPVGDGLPAQ